jgi:predicted Holliday junction resolvase-like endonuclease
MKNFLKPMPILSTIILVILLMISVSKTKYINTLEEKINNKDAYIEEIYIKTNHEHVDSLYMEIMDLGAQLDSMMLKYE